LNNIHIKFGTPRKLVRLIKVKFKIKIKMIICISKHLSDALPIQNGLNGDDLWPLLSTSVWYMSLRRLKKSGQFGKEWDTSNYGPS
jgi:hypothetical protein